MLRKVWDVAAKDLLLLSKDRMALLMLFAVPLLLMGILGAAFSGFSSTGPTVTATLPVVDHDGGPLARTLVSALRHMPALTVQMHTDEAAMRKAVRNGDQVGLLIIPRGFSAIGGSWWPLSVEPQWMQSLSKVTLNAWAMQGFNGLMVFGKAFAQVLPNIVVLFVYGLICFAIARRTFRFREA